MADKILFYGADWCGDCQRAKQFFGKHNIPYEFHDTDKEPGAKVKMMEINSGIPNIPTIVFPDGTCLIEPSDQELSQKLGIK